MAYAYPVVVTVETTFFVQGKAAMTEDDGIGGRRASSTFKVGDSDGGRTA
jgi:hypothetical protein